MLQRQKQAETRIGEGKENAMDQWFFLGSSAPTASKEEQDIHRRRCQSRADSGDECRPGQG